MDNNFKKWYKEARNKEPLSVKEIRHFLQQNTSIKETDKVVLLVEMSYKDSYEVLERGSNFIAGSWRGAYDFPVVLLNDNFYSVSEVIENLKEIDGKEVVSYKGGKYILDEHYVLFLSYSFDSTGNNRAIIDIKKEDGFVYCLTKTNLY